jgi:hypothetical protein
LRRCLPKLPLNVTTQALQSRLEQTVLRKPESPHAPGLITDGKGKDAHSGALVSIADSRSQEELLPSSSDMQVSSSQGPSCGSPSILPCKRPADSCHDDLEPKAQKSKTGHSVSALLAEMEHAGVGVGQFVTFLKSLQSEHKFLSFVAHLL